MNEVIHKQVFSTLEPTKRPVKDLVNKTVAVIDSGVKNIIELGSSISNHRFISAVLLGTSLFALDYEFYNPAHVNDLEIGPAQAIQVDSNANLAVNESSSGLDGKIGGFGIGLIGLAVFNKLYDLYENSGSVSEDSDEI